ncbi:MAG: hypothetical protein NTW01_00980 [Gammaproteobacteria bacterium]|nr:hypothetical protein [Gammaproteobacteria bacterium]
MSIKSLAHLAHQSGVAAAGPAFKRSHFYELMAAAFGYGSYAALGAESVLLKRKPLIAESTAGRLANVRSRCTSLGYGDPVSEIVASVICSVLAEQDVDVIRLNDLVERLRESGDECESYLDQFLQAEEVRSSILRESLQSAAERGSALAHYAIALLHAYDLPDDEDDGTASAYWSRQRRAGVELSGAKAEWADEYDRREESNSRYEHHLRAAASLGYKHALVDVAERFGDASVFESRLDLSDQDPIRMAVLARSVGRPDQEKHWLTIAAEGGNIEAMLDLIDGFDADDLKACWKWLHLAKLHGTDLTANDHHAINEDGSPYDDDVGGPMYVDGRDGIKLKGLNAEEDRQARVAAFELFERTRGH